MLQRLVTAGIGQSRLSAYQSVAARRQLLPAHSSSPLRPFSTRFSPLLQESNDAGREGEKEGKADEKAVRRDAGNRRGVDHSAASWKALLDTLDPTNPNELPATDFSDPRVKTSDEPMNLEVEFEEVWKANRAKGPLKPAKPSQGRSCEIDGISVDAARGFQFLNSILARNRVRHELRLGERYEKPNQTRRRLRSERHRRRFADAVRQRVQLIMDLKARGA